MGSRLAAFLDDVDGPVQVIFGTNNWNTTYRGVAPEYFDIRRWEIETGTIFTHDDVERDVERFRRYQEPSRHVFP